MEILDIVDENGAPTGKTVERELAHREGIRHRTSHVWIASVKEGEVQLLLQRRSEDKDSHPGCLDISSAGHIPAGCSYMESALRELKEELGIEAFIEELHYVGKRRKEYKKQFHGREFHDNQVSNVYIIFKQIDIDEVEFQKSEVSEVLFMSLSSVYELVKKEENDLKKTGNIILDDRTLNKSCIALEEIEMVRNFVADHPELYVFSASH